MTLHSVLMLGIVCLAVGAGKAQTISVDMNPEEDGIQETVTAADTAETLAVAIRIADVNNLYSYQCKIAFDTGSFTFLAAQQDFGLSGEKNILTKNGGSVIGIFQLQTNPPAEDTIVISGSITGDDASLSVDGDGCIGVLYFASKVQPGDSATITPTGGFLAGYGEDLTAVEEYGDGIYTVDPSVRVADRPYHPATNRSAQTATLLTIRFPAFSLRFGVPAGYVTGAGEITVTLLSVDGKMVTAHRQLMRNATRTVEVPLGNNGMRCTPGTYLCAVACRGYRFSRTVTVR